MLYIFLSICCSVIVSVMLKLAKRYHIDVYQAITWNYSMAILLSWLFLKPQFNNLQAAPVFSYLLLALLLPSLFVIIAISIRKSGIVRTEIAQRLSLFIRVETTLDKHINPLLDLCFIIFGSDPNSKLQNSAIVTVVSIFMHGKSRKHLYYDKPLS